MMPDHHDTFDVIVVRTPPEYAGVYVGAAHKLSGIRLRTIEEMICGRLNLLRQSTNVYRVNTKMEEFSLDDGKTWWPGRVPPAKFATDDEWAFALGLVIAGYATRMQL